MNDPHHPAARLRLHGYPGIDVAGRAVSVGLKHGMALLATLAA